MYIHSIAPQTVPPSPGPTGVRITNCTFDNIYSSGVLIGGSTFPDTTYLNATGYNTFYDVGNSFGGIGNPTAVIIGIYGDNNVSIGDMFERDDLDSLTYQRIQVDGQDVIAFTGGEKIEMGTYTRVSGLSSSAPGPVAIIETNSSSPNGFTSFVMNYSVDDNTGGFRTGTYLVATTGNGVITSSDDYTENLPLGITLVATQNVGNANVVITATSGSGTFHYSVNYLN